MRFGKRGRETRQLSSSCQHRLNSYAAAAAAGVGVALTNPMEAKIIYRPAHHVIRDGGSYRLDFTGNGSTDLIFRNQFFHTCGTDGQCFSTQSLTVQLAGEDRVAHNLYGAEALKQGMFIGPKRPFHGGKELMVKVFAGSAGSSGSGSWINVNNRYLGVKLSINGTPHYGWARLNVRVQPPLTITATLTGYAYETVPGKPIIAGKTKGADVITLEPGSLARLAQGSAWRLGK